MTDPVRKALEELVAAVDEVKEVRKKWLREHPFYSSGADSELTVADDRFAKAWEAARAALAAPAEPLPEPESELGHSAGTLLEVHALGAPASPSGSTLQPPAAASAAIPSANKPLMYGNVPRIGDVW